MWTKGFSLWRLMLCTLLVVSALAAAARGDDEIPSESQCRPYIEKALKELESGDAEHDSAEKNDSSEVSINDETNEVSSAEDGGETSDTAADEAPPLEVADEPYIPQASIEDSEAAINNELKADSGEQEDENKQDDGDSNEGTASAEEQIAEQESEEAKEVEADNDSKETTEDVSGEAEAASKGEASKEDDKSEETADGSEEAKDENSQDEDGSQDKADESQEDIEKDDSQEVTDESKEAETQSAENSKADSAEEKDESSDTKDDTAEDQEESGEDKSVEEQIAEGQGLGDDSEEDQTAENKSVEDQTVEDQTKEDQSAEDQTAEDQNAEEQTAEDESVEDQAATEEKDGSEEKDKSDEKEESTETAEAEGGVEETVEDSSDKADSTGQVEEKAEETDSEGSEEPSEDASQEEAIEEDLLLTIEIPENLRSRDHITQILRLDAEASEDELTVERSADIILRDLKRTYENSIKPLETLYKYRDLSNRHFGDPEIFSKPLVLFMGPWSGGKSSILNYLTGLEFTEWSLRTGAEPSPAYFNILMHGKEPAVLDGTQLAADWTFSGLQKFGQGLEERLRGLKHPSKILEKVNIVEIPGILEVRKQVSRVFPFNDACQWFIDRADIIFLVYDPSKLDVGPETEAILDQLKGRESQTRIVLNKADSVKPEELMRVQSALIWNISPLMSSAQPPAMYTVSLWSMPYEAGAPVRLLQAQERELLKDLRHAIDKRIENKIASARRFAVRVRNHAKMVDCYLTTYYNHKTIFGNRKLIADAIIENPQNYHIYEGLSTLTNISRYDLPDPETYRDFFRLNPLYEFQQLSATCTYFRGCPITRLDVAIAYDLPELVGKYKKMVETATPQGMPKS